MAGLRRWLLVLTVLGLGVGCAPEAPGERAPEASAERATRESATATAVPAVPPVSEQARAAGFVDVRTVVPDAVLDLRYATPDNFVGVALYPPSARCLVHESMGPGLVTAAARLRDADAVLVFWDCYRPHETQVRMFEAVPDPGWVARPGDFARSHEAGRSVDVTFVRNGGPCPPERRSGDRCLADMGTDFDEFSPAAQAFATAGVDLAAQADRALLRAAMLAGGLAVYPGEWWHFDGPGAYIERPILDVPVG